MYVCTLLPQFCTISSMCTYHHKCIVAKSNPISWKSVPSTNFYPQNRACGGKKPIPGACPWDVRDYINFLRTARRSWSLLEGAVGNSPAAPAGCPAGRTSPARGRRCPEVLMSLSFSFRWGRTFSSGFWVHLRNGIPSQSCFWVPEQTAHGPQRPPLPEKYAACYKVSKEKILLLFKPSLWARLESRQIFSVPKLYRPHGEKSCS